MKRFRLLEIVAIPTPQEAGMMLEKAADQLAELLNWYEEEAGIAVTKEEQIARQRASSWQKEA